MQRIAELVQQVVNMPGTSIENNGQVILAGTIPGTKPVQYRYEFFKPLTDEEIKSVSDSSRRPFPKQLAQLYKITNGANLFGRFIRINGIPAWGADYKQPCSLIFEDGHRTVLCPKSRLFFASYYTQPQIQFFLIQKNLKMQCVCMQQDMAATKSLQSGHLSKNGCTANIKNTWTNFKMETIN